MQLANTPVVDDAAESPTSTTLVGIVTDVMPKHRENAPLATLVNVNVTTFAVRDGCSHEITLNAL